MNWELGFSRPLPYLLLVFSALSCVAALSSDARVPAVRSAPRPSRALAMTENPALSRTQAVRQWSPDGYSLFNLIFA